MGGGFGENGTCMCMAESLHCSPETITTLLIDYTPIQNKKLNVWRKKKKKDKLFAISGNMLTLGGPVLPQAEMLQDVKAL